VHILCKCEALALPRHKYLGSFLDPEDIRVLGVGGGVASGTLLKEQGSYNLVQNRGYNGPVLRPKCSEPERVHTTITILFYSVITYKGLYE
jgi:hypothetical protein